MLTTRNNLKQFESRKAFLYCHRILHFYLFGPSLLIVGKGEKKGREGKGRKT